MFIYIAVTVLYINYNVRIIKHSRKHKKEFFGNSLGKFSWIIDGSRLHKLTD